MKGNKDAPKCGFSNTVVQVFKSMDVPFETVDILADDGLRAGMKVYSDWPTFPQVYIDGEFFGGSTGGLLRKAQVRLFAYIDRLIVSLRVNASARWMLPSDFLPLKQTVSQNQGNSFSWFWYIFS